MSAAVPGSLVVTVPVVIKVDSHGSIAAIQELLGALPTDKVEMKLAHCGVGPVTLSDVEVAVAAGLESDRGQAPIYAFNVAMNGGDVTTAAKRSKVTTMNNPPGCGSIPCAEFSCAVLTLYPNPVP